MIPVDRTLSEVWKDEAAEKKYRKAWLEAEYIVAGWQKVEQEVKDDTSRQQPV